MKKIAILFGITALIACNNKPVEEVKNTKLVWAENAATLLPMETDTVWDGSNLINATNKFDRDKLFSSAVNAVINGKLKAYKNFPNEELSVTQVKNIIVQWDSLAYAEDPNNPGVFISAPIKMEVTASSISHIQFNETIELDTVAYTLTRKTSYITLYAYKRTEKGEAVGIIKLFDIKLNE